MGVVFDKLQKIKDHKTTSTRLRSLIWAAIDLRKSNAIPKEDVVTPGVKPKTVGQIHREKLAEQAAVEQGTKQHTSILTASADQVSRVVYP